LSISAKIYHVELKEGNNQVNRQLVAKQEATRIENNFYTPETIEEKKIKASELRHILIQSYQVESAT
jgi:hypothetical protein